jgi:hypothetical protein
MRSIQQGPPPASPAVPANRAPARVVVLATWRAEHGVEAPLSRRRRQSIWLAIVAALLLLGPAAFTSLVRHRATPAQAAAAVNELTFGD